MKELLETIARGLVVNKDGVTVTVDDPNEENVVVSHLQVAPVDMSHRQAGPDCQGGSGSDACRRNARKSKGRG